MKTVKVSKENFDRLMQDIEDMTNARKTVFKRCACGRIREVGINCRNPYCKVDFK
jgi:hypothetical protein